MISLDVLSKIKYHAGLLNDNWLSNHIEQLIEGYVALSTPIDTMNSKPLILPSTKPIFILVGSDKLAADPVLTWAYDAERSQYPSSQVEAARQCARSMRDFYSQSQK